MGQYKPDFHLTEAAIYIEHFPLSAACDTPPFIDREKYLEERAWKLQLHTACGTTRVQTFSHEQAPGRLTESLRESSRHTACRSNRFRGKRSSQY